MKTAGATIALLALLTLALVAGRLEAQEAREVREEPATPAPAPAQVSVPQADMGHFEQYVGVLQRYFDLVAEFNELAQDPSASGVAAVVGSKALLEQRGAPQAITYYTELLPEVTDPAVRRAIRLTLVELYKDTDQTDAALEQLRILMTDTQ